MKTAAAGHSDIGRKGFASRLVVFLSLLAFVLQSYIAQTHIHILAQSPAELAKIAATQIPSQGKSPLNNSPVDCPFCQTAALTGVFVAPSVLLLYLPLTWVKSVLSSDTALAASASAAHDWQSRAPPRL